jgi:hypothetical protein
MTAGVTAKIVLVVALPAILLTTAPGPRRSAARAQESAAAQLPGPVLPDTSASIGTHIRANVDAYATPEFRFRKAVRREFQRAGYANVLHDILALDPPGALLSFIRTRLRIEYSLPHNTIHFRDDLGQSWPLPEDWTFPADPWAD